MRRLIPGLLAALATLAAPDARADVAACIEAHANGQALKNHNALESALAAFRSCADPACPDIVRNECVGFLDDVISQLPLLRLDVQADGPTQNEGQTKVFIDGAYVGVAPLPEEFRIRAGHHVVAFERPGFKRLELPVDVAERISEVPLVARLEPVAPPVKATATRALTPLPADSSGSPSGKTPTAVWVLGGSALVGAAAFAGFGLAGNGVAGCAGSCSEAEVHRMKAFYAVADIGLVASLATAGAGLYLYLSQSPRQPAPAASWRLRPEVRVIATGNGLAIDSRF